MSPPSCGLRQVQGQPAQRSHDSSLVSPTRAVLVRVHWRPGARRRVGHGGARPGNSTNDHVIEFGRDRCCGAGDMCSHFPDGTLGPGRQGDAPPPPEDGGQREEARACCSRAGEYTPPPEVVTDTSESPLSQVPQHPHGVQLLTWTGAGAWNTNRSITPPVQDAGRASPLHHPKWADAQSDHPTLPVGAPARETRRGRMAACASYHSARG